MRRPAGIGALAAAVLASACASAPLDADPSNLQIEIGRYGALLDQVAEHTGVARATSGGTALTETPDALMAELNAAVADYNGVRRALCASRASGQGFAQIRAGSCGRDDRPGWSGGTVDYETVARRSRAAGGPIIALWSAVCAEAARVAAAGPGETCPME